MVLIPMHLLISHWFFCFFFADTLRLDVLPVTHIYAITAYDENWCFLGSSNYPQLLTLWGNPDDSLHSAYMIKLDLFLGHIIVRNVHSAGQETVFLYLVQYHFRLNSTQFIKSNTNLGDSMSRVCEHITFFGAITALSHKTAISWIISYNLN